MREGRMVKVVLLVTVSFNLMSCVLVLLLGRTCQTNFFTCRAYEGKEQEYTSYVLDASRRNINRSCWFRSGYDENLGVMCIFLFVFVTMVAGTEFIWNNLSRVGAVDKVLIFTTSKHFAPEDSENSDGEKRENASVTEILTTAAAEVSREYVTFDVEVAPESTCTYSSMIKVFIFYLLKSAIQLILAYLFAMNTFWSEWGWQHLWLGDKKWCWLPRSSAKLELECHPTALGRTIGFLMITDGVLSFFLCVYLTTYMIYLPVMLYAKVSSVRADMEHHGITSTWKIFSFMFYIWLCMSGNEINVQSRRKLSRQSDSQSTIAEHIAEHVELPSLKLKVESDGEVSDERDECL